MQFDYGGQTYKKVALLGVGNHYINFQTKVSRYIQFAFYVDNDIEKQGRNILGDGIDCIAPQEMKQKGIDFVVISPHD